MRQGAADHRIAGDRGDLALVVGGLSVVPLFCAVLITSVTFYPGGDTPPVFLASVALPFLGVGAILTAFAGRLLAKSDLFPRANRHPLGIPGLVLFAFALVVPAIAEMGEEDDHAMGLILLAATALSFGLTWLAAVGLRYAAIVTFLLGAVLLAVASGAE